MTNRKRIIFFSILGLLSITISATQTDSLHETEKTAPVIGFFDDTLFVIHGKLGSFSAHDRALAVSERIKKLPGGTLFSDSTLKIVAAETTVDVMHGETIIVSISENDARRNNMTKEELAENYRMIISDAVLIYKHETNILTLAKEIGLATIVLTIFGVLLYYCGKLFKWTGRKITEQEGKKIAGVKIKNAMLFDAKRQISAILWLNTLLKWFIIILLTYATLPLVFSFFPWTQNFAETLYGYILNPLQKIVHSIWHYLPNLFTIVILFLVFRYAIKGLHFLKTEIESGKVHLSGFYPDWANPTFQILRIILYAFMFVLIFPYIPGSDSPVFQGVSVFLGFLFTFGSAGSLSNIIAGTVLTYMRLFKIGDRVKIGDVVGDVVEKSMLVTRVRTIKNEIVSIPNSTIMSSHTINYNYETEMGQGLILNTKVTVGYEIPWPKTHQVLLEAANRTNLLLKDPKPFVLQTSLDDFYVSYQINAYTKEPNKQADIYSELHRNIQDCCNEAGIELLSPHYKAVRDGNQIAIPDNYLTKDYQTPGLNINLKKENN